MRQFLKQYLPKNTKARLLMLERLVKLLVSPQVIRDLYIYDEAMAEAGTQGSKKRFSTKIKDVFPITGDKTIYTSFDRHYVYHTSWAARVVAELSAESKKGSDAIAFRHVDMSSSLYFSGLVSAFVPVDFYDYRPADLRLDGLTTHKGDLLRLPFDDASIASISCLHTIEHVGLGRYGDPIDPDGDIKALEELKRVVKPGGSLLIVVPVGRQRIEFNAHRIYAPSHMMDIVCGASGKAAEFELREYAYIPETDKEGGIQRNADLSKGSADRYACGCFWFVRKQ